MARSEIKCACGRAQSIVPAHESGGVTYLEAQAFGWECRDGVWHCPFCTGKTEKLKRIFDRSTADDGDEPA